MIGVALQVVALYFGALNLFQPQLISGMLFALPLRAGGVGRHGWPRYASNWVVGDEVVATRHCSG